MAKIAIYKYFGTQLYIKFKRNVRKKAGVLAKEKELKGIRQDKILISKQMNLCISVLLSTVLEKDRVH